jgi:hypothetical protein
MDAGGLPFTEDIRATDKQQPRGIFGEYPGATPKYATNKGEQNDFRETLARLFIQVPDYEKFKKDFENDPASKRIAEVISGSAGTDGATNIEQGNGYIDFLLQSVQHNFQEKNQIIETLADEHIAYFFGQAAPVFSYGGTLINTRQDDQAMNMLRLYRDMGRGSQLALRRTLLSIRYDGLIVSGAMMSLSLGLSAELEMAVPFSFNLLVKQISLLPPHKNSAVVELTKPFANSGDMYTPFNTNVPDYSTSAVKVTGVPPVFYPPPPAAAIVKPAEAPVKDRKPAVKAFGEAAANSGTARTGELTAGELKAID